MGHATDRAILLGLAGNEPAAIDPAAIESTVAAIRSSRRIDLAGKRAIAFDEPHDLLFHRDQMFPPGASTKHPNGMRFTAFDAEGAILAQRTFFSIGGGFIAEDGEADQPSREPEVRLPYPFHSAAELLEIARAHSLSIDRVMLANECERLRASTPAQAPERAKTLSNCASAPASSASGKPCRRVSSAAWPQKEFCPEACKCAAARDAWPSACALARRAGSKAIHWRRSTG